jgi:hypothetical protein
MARYALPTNVSKGGEVHISGGNMTAQGPGRLHFSACGSTRGATCKVTTLPLTCEKCKAGRASGL